MKPKPLPQRALVETSEVDEGVVAVDVDDVFAQLDDEEVALTLDFATEMEENEDVHSPQLFWQPVPQYAGAEPQYPYLEFSISTPS